MQSGTQTGAIDAAAKAQKQAGTMQEAFGAVNAFMAAWQFKRARNHGKNAEAIAKEGMGETNIQVRDSDEKAVRAAGTMTDQAINRFNLEDGSVAVSAEAVETLRQAAVANPGNIDAQREYEQAAAKRQAALAEKGKAIKTALGGISQDAQNEQRGVKDNAQTGAIASFVMGVSQFMAGKMQKKAADLNADAAKKLANNGGGNLPGFDGLADGGDPEAPRQGYTVNPNGEQAETTAETSDDDNSEDDGGLGEGFNPNNPGDQLTGNPLPPADFKVGSAGAVPPGSGAGPGLSGGGGLSPGSPVTEDAAPRYAGAVNNSDKMESGTGGGSRGGGNGGGGADAPFDPSALLAKFLPQKEDAQAKGTILDYGRARGPAAQAPDSLLDRSANIFERIHKTYQEKSSKGLIGMN
jgi:hypothetical protein